MGNIFSKRGEQDEEDLYTKKLEKITRKKSMHQTLSMKKEKITLFETHIREIEDFF